MRPLLNGGTLAGLLFCSYCTEPVTETSAGEFLCGQGASLSKLVGTRLRELVGTPERRRTLESGASSKWYCPRCAVSMIRAGTETVCPACALNLTRLIYQVLEFNPHVPAPSPPLDAKIFLELHDSTLQTIDAHGFSLRAYVHRWARASGRWIGTGWLQCFQFDIANVHALRFAPSLPQSISGGALQLADTVYENLLPYPGPACGPMQLALELVGGDSLSLDGALQSVRAVDEARYVEPLPDDMAPAG